jgi:hypothetical protein
MREGDQETVKSYSKRLLGECIVVAYVGQRWDGVFIHSQVHDSRRFDVKFIGRRLKRYMMRAG